MPLVTRQANTGNLFNQAIEPPDWLDGDLWSDTTANRVKVNVGGTATLIGREIWTVIETYEAALAEADHTFTFTGIDFDDDSKLVLNYDITGTLAFTLQLKINALVVGYFFDGSSFSGGTETQLHSNAGTDWPIGSVVGVNEETDGVAQIQLSKGGSLDRPTMVCHEAHTDGSRAFGGGINAAVTSITDIVLETSTSTWQAGSRATLYRVRRAAAT